MTFADKVIRFNKQLVYTGQKLPPGIRVMNPFREFANTLDISSKFYHKYYNDGNARHLILGINPGRLGAGLTGVPFTDPKRLVSICNIEYSGKPAHEPSSVFIYDMIAAYGGPEKFYSRFYINSLSPLGFTSIEDNGTEKNHNYYDSKALTDAVYSFIVDNVKKQISLGIFTNVCFCFGTGKNEAFLKKLNDRYHFFKKVVALEHPRYIMQYKNAQKQFYINKYISAFNTETVL